MKILKGFLLFRRTEQNKSLPYCLQCNSVYRKLLIFLNVSLEL